ncbi:MAG: hypothetical protein WC360_08490, partial [Opitutales bacterium]
ALGEEALGAEQDDPFPAIIADVAQRVRAEVRANNGNTLDPPAGTVPPELRGAAIALIIEAAQARLPSLALSADQARLANAARALLKRVAAGDVGISPGESAPGGDDDDVVSAPRIVLVASRSNPLTGSALLGL